MARTKTRSFCKLLDGSIMLPKVRISSHELQAIFSLHITRSPCGGISWPFWSTSFCLPSFRFGHSGPPDCLDKENHARLFCLFTSMHSFTNPFSTLTTLTTLPFIVRHLSSRFCTPDSRVFPGRIIPQSVDALAHEFDLQARSHPSSIFHRTFLSAYSS